MINNLLFPKKLRIHTCYSIFCCIVLYSCTTDAKQPKAGAAQEIMGGYTFAPVDSAETLPDSNIRQGMYYEDLPMVQDEVINDEPAADTANPVIPEPEIIDTLPVNPDKIVEYGYEDPAPQFPGGEKAMLEYIKQNIHYPVSAQEQGLSGKVYINFTITETGKVDSVRLLRGFYDSCDMEALRVIRAMPDWQPATRNGKAIKVKINLPVIFKMQ